MIPRHYLSPTGKATVMLAVFVMRHRLEQKRRERAEQAAAQLIAKVKQ